MLTKDHLPAHEYGKLATNEIGPEEIVEMINLEAYHLKLPE